MAGNQYVFVTRWRVSGRIERAYEILIDVENYPRWWSQVYLKIEPLTKSAGDRARLLTRGKLPYQIRWQSEIVATNPPHGFTIRATGDFDGRGIWSLQQKDNNVAITFDYRWAMAHGEEGLRREMARPP
jgi:hypothetical protein